MLLIEDVKVCTVLTGKNCFLIIKHKYIQNVCILNSKGNITGIRGAVACNIDVIRVYREPILRMPQFYYTCLVPY